MKPQDLKVPFSWNKRHVAIEDRVWYVPSYYYDYESFNFPGWTHPSTFSEERPIHIEYCSGNGAWLADKALQNPHINWVGVEKRFERVRKIWSKIKRFKLDNLLIVCGEAYKTTHCYFPSCTVSEIFINFPDPWPKTRHAKHRLIQPSLLDQLHRILQAGGIVTFVTDDVQYSNWTIEMFKQSPYFECLYPEPHFAMELPNYGTSFFEELWREKGRVIRYHQFRKSGEI